MTTSSSPAEPRILCVASGAQTPEPVLRRRSSLALHDHQGFLELAANVLLTGRWRLLLYRPRREGPSRRRREPLGHGGLPSSPISSGTRPSSVLPSRFSRSGPPGNNQCLSEQYSPAPVASVSLDLLHFLFVLTDTKVGCRIVISRSLGLSYPPLIPVLPSAALRFHREPPRQGHGRSAGRSSYSGTASRVICRASEERYQGLQESIRNTAAKSFAEGKLGPHRLTDSAEGRTLFCKSPSAEIGTPILLTSPLSISFPQFSVTSKRI